MQQYSAFIRSFVRRDGRFTKAQRTAIQKHWAHYGIEITHERQFLNPKSVFIKNQPTILDVGFGNGESILALAKLYPKFNFLGVEVYRPGIGNLLRNAFDAKLENIRVINLDVVQLLHNNMMADSLTAVLIWFPDPWPKKRHHKRRLIQEPFLQLITDKLIARGELNIATDWKPYAEHIQEVIQKSELFEKINSSSLIDHRPQTKFERRGEKLGHDVFAAVYRKLT